MPKEKKGKAPTLEDNSADTPAKSASMSASRTVSKKEDEAATLLPKKKAKKASEEKPKRSAKPKAESQAALSEVTEAALQESAPKKTRKAKPQAAPEAEQNELPSEAPALVAADTATSAAPVNEAPKTARKTRQSKAKAAPEAEEAPAKAKRSRKREAPAAPKKTRKAKATEDATESVTQADVPVAEASAAEDVPVPPPAAPLTEPEVSAERAQQGDGSGEQPDVFTQGSEGSDQDIADLVTSQLRKMGRPVHVRDFERSFTRAARSKLGRDISRLLEDLTRSGQVIRTRRNTYGLPEAMNLVRGRFQASSSGFGFVIPDSGGEDFYIREGETLEAWNGDTVLVRPEGRERPFSRQGGRNDSPRAAVVRIVQRAYSRLVGSLEYLRGYAFLKPDDHRARHRILLVQEGLEGLPAGARLVAQLFWPEDTGEDEVYGEVAQVLGDTDDPAAETQAVIVKHGLHSDFPPEVLEEAQRIAARVPATARRGRLDLRDANIFTVDGSDAKDFDDAIHIQATPEGTFIIGVHIADVSHYVKPGSALDAEAYARATSVYLPGCVLPMLPEHLSNGVCSLVPNEDRLTLSAMLELSGDGELLSASFAPSVIRSKARLTYDEVQAYSEASATLPEHARALEGNLHLLLKMTAKLRQKRLREGALDFKLREVKVDIGTGGHMQLIPLREETARGMIEDLMLLANKAVAHFLLEKNVPTLYRIHEEPTLGRFQEASAAIARLGLAFPGDEPTPQAYQAVLRQVRGTPQESVVNTVLLRSLQQAKYAESNLGHFGLAFEEYLHFTSPIRRYPDLLVHRALKLALALRGPVSNKLRAELAAPLPEQGRHTSERERNAAEAERDLTKYYQAKWAQEHLHETFEGRVSGVIASGLFVALENGVEGRLHISNLDDDYYVFIEEAGILKGRSAGRIYRIGDTLQVSVSNVNPLARQIDFAQENSMDGNKPRARRREDREAQKREKLSNFLPQSAAQDAQPKEAQREGQERGQRPLNRQKRRGVPSSASYEGPRRRVVTLERPRNEHLRPVNITVQRMYFGDWTLDHLPPEDGQSSGGFRGNFKNRQGRPQRYAEAQPRRSEGLSRPTESSEEAKRRRRRRGRRGAGQSESNNGPDQQ